MPAQLTLTVRTADGVTRSRQLAPGAYVLGREADCDVVVESSDVSRHHARFILAEQDFQIVDLGSTLGTKLNGQALRGPQRARYPAMVQLGSVNISLKAGGGEGQSPWHEEDGAPLAANPDAGVPYVFRNEIARGGMGSILEAKDCKLGRSVAVKIMLSELEADDAQKQRFINEAAVLGRLEHPNVVPIHDIGRDSEGQLYYSMKLVHGRTLQAILNAIREGDAEMRKGYTLDRLLTIFRKVCDAMAFAHSRGIIHRDLKPENVMVGEFGEVLVMDWGLAKMLVDGSDLKVERPKRDAAEEAVSNFGMTMDGDVMGTPQYMSPEQAEGRVADMDARSDIFSLGGILYCILTLRPPVDGSTLEEVLRKVASGSITPLITRAKQGAGLAKSTPKNERRLASALPWIVPPALAAVTMKALSVAREKRYQKVAGFTADVEAYQGGFATGAEKAGAWKQFTLLVKRNKAASIGVAAVLLLSIGFTAKVITEGRRAESALADLRSAAPTLIGQARGLIDEQKFDEALAKIDFAVKIEGKNADYRLLRAQLLEATLHLDDAAAEFRRVLALGPNDSAVANLALCEKLLRDNKNPAELDDPSLKALHEMLVKEQRSTQDVPLAARLGLGKAATDARIKALFDAWRKLPGWDKVPEKDRFRYNADGTVMLVLDRLPISDLSVLKGIPVSDLNISSTKVEDLSPLAGLRLVTFIANLTSISDLSPLRGMALKSINLGACLRVENLLPLAGMPLESCILSGVQATDFSPLKGCPIKELNLTGTRITTLDTFAGMPCERLVAQVARALVDISAVRTMRLKFVSFNASVGIADLAPLADCTELEEVSVPSEAKNVASLRRLMKLRSINYGNDDRCSPEELWVKLGIGDARNREHIAVIQKTRAAMAAADVPNPDANWVKVLPDGTLDIIAGKCKTLAPLRGLPVSLLDINHSSITDLSPLAGMPLRKLNMQNTRITDLSPLAKCRKLEILLCHDSAVRDLSPVAGLPLVYLNARNDSISSITPLAKMPLKELRIDRTAVSDLRPLLSCPTLEWLMIPAGARDVGQLQALKKLVRLSERWDSEIEGSSYDHGGPAQTAEEFWKDYDAQKKSASSH